MKKVIFAIGLMLTVVACNNSAKVETPATDSTKVAVDTVKVDTTLVNVDTTKAK